MQSARAKDVFFSKVKYKRKAKILLVYIKKLDGYYIKILVMTNSTHDKCGYHWCKWFCSQESFSDLTFAISAFLRLAYGRRWLMDGFFMEI